MQQIVSIIMVLFLCVFEHVHDNYNFNLGEPSYLTFSQPPPTTWTNDIVFADNQQPKVCFFPFFFFEKKKD